MKAIINEIINRLEEEKKIQYHSDSETGVDMLNLAIGIVKQVSSKHKETTD